MIIKALALDVENQLGPIAEAHQEEYENIEFGVYARQEHVVEEHIFAEGGPRVDVKIAVGFLKGEK